MSSSPFPKPKEDPLPVISPEHTIFLSELTTEHVIDYKADSGQWEHYAVTTISHNKVDVQIAHLDGNHNSLIYTVNTYTYIYLMFNVYTHMYV